jgi:hypothetical protein
LLFIHCSDLSSADLCRPVPAPGHRRTEIRPWRGR